MTDNVQIITTPAGEKMALMPLDHYEDLIDQADIAAANRIKADVATGENEMFPEDLVARILNGENPIRVFRQHRSLLAGQLSSAAGISQSYLSDLENGKKTGSISVLRRIANVLCVSLEDITPSK